MIYLDFVREVSGLVQEIRKIDEFLYKIKDQRQRALSDAEEEFSRKQSEIQGNYQHSLKGNETDYKKKKDGLSVTRKELEKCLASLGNVKRTAGGREYDSERLSELMVQLDEVSFLSSLKKRFGILGYQSDRKSKRESYEIIQAGLNLIDEKENKLLQTFHENRNRIDAQKTSSMESNASACQNKKNRIENEYRAQMQEWERRGRGFWNSGRLIDLRDHITQEAKSHGLVAEDWKTYIPAVRKCREICLGKMYMPMNISQEAYGKVRGLVPAYTNENGLIRFPFILPYASSLCLWLEFGQEGRDRALEGIRRLLLNFVRFMPMGQYHISFLDPLERGTSIQRLKKLTKNEDCDICYEPCASVEDSIKHLTMLQQQFDTQYSHRLAGIDNIEKYNEKASNPLEYHIIVVNDISEFRENAFYRLLKVMTDNAAKFGISIIILNNHRREKDLEQNLGQNKELNYFKNMYLEKFERLEWREGFRSKEGFRVVLSGNEKIEERYLDEVAAYYKKAQLIENDFDKYICCDEKRIVLKDPCNEGRIRIPFAVGKDGKIRELELGTPENSFAMIIGGIGSGKSTTLHSLIASIALHYHPDDVELWLLDFKFTEMKKYKDMNWIPHIKLIGMDTEDAFSSGILRKIDEEFDKRKRMITKDIYQYEKERRQGLHTKKLPHIIVILDEYQILINSVNGTDERGLVTNFLRIGRALGVYFIFSSQTATKLLTEQEMGQISSRMFMRIDKAQAPMEKMEFFGSLKGDEKDLVDNLSDNLGTGTMVLRYNSPKGQGVSEVAYERVRSLYLSESFQKKLLPQIKNMSLFKGYIEKRTLCYEGRIRKRMDRKDITADEQEMGYTGGVDPNNIGASLLYLGTPVGPSAYTRMFLAQSRSENVMLIGRNRKLQYAVLRGLISSYKRKTGQDKDNGEVLILAEEYNQLFMEYGQDWKAMEQNVGKGLRVTCEMDSICREIHNLADAVRTKKKLPCLVIIMGLPDILEAMSKYPKEYKGNTVPEKKMETDHLAVATEAKAATAEAKAVTAEERRKARLEALRKFVAEEGAEGIRRASAQSASFDQLQTEKSDVPSVKEQGVTPAQPEERCEYDGRTDLKDLIMKNGAVFGMHIIITADTYGEIKGGETRGYDTFCRHRIACGLTKDDYISFMGNTKAGDMADQNTAVYFDGGKIQYFLPFLF